MRWIVSTAVLILSLPTASPAGDSVVVHLFDGRTTAGALDSATDSSRLWLNVSEGGIALRSGFEWSDIRVVVHDSRHLPADEFRNVVGRLASSSPPLMDVPNPATRALNEVVAATERADITSAAFSRTVTPPVRSLRVRAWVANWDDDPELDGILVEVTPLGPHGEFVPVDGQISMTLIGEHSQGDPENFRTFRRRYPEIARGSEQVRSDHFWGGPAVYQLPYRNLFPEAHLDLFPQGVLTATLGVPGQGNFTASTDALSLVPASPIRDRRQQWFGRRYFPQELSWLRDGSRFGKDRKMQFISLGMP
jgi:hypothetical protein